MYQNNRNGLRIGLIYPNRYEKFKIRVPSFYKLPPLNLLTIAGLTPEKHKIEIIDERYEKLDFEREYDLVGITTLTCNAPRAYKISEEFRKRGIKTVLGGIHPSTMPDEAKKFSDSVVIGEAETSWQHLLEDLQDGRLEPFYNGGLCDLKDSPTPRWDLLGNKNRYIAFVQTTRGCPYNCSFCTVPMISGRKIRTKPVGKVVEEIKETGKRMIIFVDDNILVNKDYARDLFNALIPLKIRWASESSITTLRDQELIELAAKSGCRAFYIGFETIRKEALQFLNKAFNKIKDFKTVINRLHEKGIAVVGSLMFGTDEDDVNIFKEVPRFIEELGVDGATFSILTPMPGTYLFKKFNEENRILTHDWSKYDTLHPVYLPKKMSKEQLKRGLRDAYEKFYTIGRVVRRSVRSIWFAPFLSYVNLAFMNYSRNGLTPV